VALSLDLRNKPLSRPDLSSTLSSAGAATLLSPLGGQCCTTSKAPRAYFVLVGFSAAACDSAAVDVSTHRSWAGLCCLLCRILCWWRAVTARVKHRSPSSSWCQSVGLRLATSLPALLLRKLVTAHHCTTIRQQLRTYSTHGPSKMPCYQHAKPLSAAAC
jgi:hypothetical protein